MMSRSERCWCFHDGNAVLVVLFDEATRCYYCTSAAGFDQDMLTHFSKDFFVYGCLSTKTLQDMLIHFSHFFIGEDIDINHARTAGEIALACPCGVARVRTPWPAPVHKLPPCLPRFVGKCGRLPLMSLMTGLGIPAPPASPRCTECRKAFPIPEWQCSECGAVLHQQCMASHDEICMVLLAREVRSQRSASEIVVGPNSRCDMESWSGHQQPVFNGGRAQSDPLVWVHEGGSGAPQSSRETRFIVNQLPLNQLVYLAPVCRSFQCSQMSYKDAFLGKHVFLLPRGGHELNAEPPFVAGLMKPAEDP